MQDVFDGLVGQQRAVDELRAHAQRPVHAYLFVGPAGSGKLDAAKMFASALVGDDRALRDAHPDVTIVERQGASISVEQAREVTRLASLMPVESRHKVIVLNEFHLVGEVAPALLKTIEEATDSTVFVVLADSITPDLVTIASRCVQVAFTAVDAQLVAQRLIEEGVETDRAEAAAGAARGSLMRARLFVSDSELMARRESWTEVLSRLDGTGYAQWKLAQEISTALDKALEPLVAKQEEQSAADKEMEREFGVKGTPARIAEAAFKREQRRFRTDELRSGFATIREQIASEVPDVRDTADAKRITARLEAVGWAEDALQYNPSDNLLLHGLFARLDAAG